MKLRVVITVAIIAILYLVSGPRQLGGPATYVTTFGISMEPGINAGDLVIAKAAETYEIGETVAYPSEILGGQTVLHRIVDETPEGFVTQGDNNDWEDRDRPTTDEIYGKQWLHIPQGGVWLNRLAQPAAVGGIVFLLLIWSILAVQPAHRPRRLRRRTLGAVPHKPSVKSGSELPSYPRRGE
ncbi:MAG: signal peptidase I [Actinomycetia bacterium]|nr:signal peptidase I [Actinomycetes bacterium]